MNEHPEDRGQPQLDESTRAADQRDAEASHRADRPPTPEEDRIADALPPVDPEVADHYQEMGEIGASVRGEGAIEG